MCKLINVIKFNDNYFEYGDEVVVTKKDNSVIVGSIMIEDGYGNVDHSLLYIDISEKYHRKVDIIIMSDIVNIQKINE